MNEKVFYLPQSANNISLVAQVFLATMLDNANDKREITISHKELGKLLNRCARTGQRMVRQLLAAGCIEIVKETEGSVPATYRIL